MEDVTKELLDEAIKIEKNMSKLYSLYEETFSDDARFWRELVKEEIEHAALLEVAEAFEDIMPEALVHEQHLDEMRKTNKEIETTIEKYRKEQPSKEEAYQFAYDCEEQAFELHYQEVVTGSEASEATKRFNKLNADDKDHALRIKELMDQVL